MILSSTIPALKFFQMPVELVLISILLVRCTKIKLEQWQVVILWTLLIETAFSVINLNIVPFLTTAKNNTLAVLTLIYFSEVSFKSKIVFPVFVITTLLLVANYISPEIVLPLISLTYNEEFNLSRFGGIFLNAHFNAVFMSVAILYYSQLKYFYGLFGMFMILFNGSKFVAISYIAHFFTVLPKTKFINIHRRKFYYNISLLYILILIIIIINYNQILDAIILDSIQKQDMHNSVIVIMQQLKDPAYYLQLFNIFPVGNVGEVKGSNSFYGLHDGANEIGYFGLVNQSGLFLAVLYLRILLKKAKYFSVFIIMSLVHNNYIMAPIIIYMMIEYSRRIQSMYDIRVEKGEITNNQSNTIFPKTFMGYSR